MPVDDVRLIGLVRQGLPEGQVIGVALSGGGDSTALLHLALEAGLRVKAVTVDHRLRDTSAAEAAGVARDCAGLGVPHVVLVWDHGPVVTGNLMDAARRARMALIRDWALGQGIAHVALGHTRDDQAETVLMGLARAAGVAGLSGMRRQWTDAGVTFHRPLLDAGRAELRDWLQARGLAWVDDPTNENPRFTRIKARRALAVLAPLGITAERLAVVAGHLGQVQDAIEAQVRVAAGQHLFAAAGALKVGPGLWDEPAEVQRQVLAAAISWLTQAPYLPRADDLGRLQQAVASGRDATLHGCRHHKGWLLREARAVGGPVPQGALWDGRWRVAGAAGTVRALGPDGLRQCAHWRTTGLPRQVLEVTPGLWQGDLLIAAPSAGFGPATATCSPEFHASLLSH